MAVPLDERLPFLWGIVPAHQNYLFPSAELAVGSQYGAVENHKDRPLAGLNIYVGGDAGTRTHG
jgi:hypothetical protein